MKKEKKDVDSLFRELYSELESETDVERLIQMFKVFNSGRFEFLSPYYTRQIAARIVHNSICLEYGDFFMARNLSGDLLPYQYLSANGYFDNVSDIRKKINEGLSITARPFLKSGNFPKHRHWTEYIFEKDIIMIVRGFNFKQSGDEKKIYKTLLQFYSDNLDSLNLGVDKPLIINI